MSEQIGPFYRAEQVAQLLGITRQAVHERTKKGRLLALRTADDVLVYPTLQFDGRRIVGGLPGTLTEFREADRWAVAAWLVSPTAALAGMKPIEAIQSGEDLRTVSNLARDALKRWNQ